MARLYATLLVALLAASAATVSVAIEAGTYECIKALLALNGDVCQVTSLTACASSCQEALDAVEASPGVTADCYDTMASIFDGALEAGGVGGLITFDGYMGDICGLSVSRNDTVKASPEEESTVNCFQTLSILQYEGCAGVSPGNCPDKCKEGLRALEADSGITQDCIDTFADMFVASGAGSRESFDSIFVEGCDVTVADS